MPYIIHLARTVLLAACYIVLSFVGVCMLPGTATAQVGTAQSVTDRYTPSGAAPGAPAGSYPLSGFDNVNLFNGHLSFALPLLQVGGRGEAGYTITHSVERNWRSVTRRFYVGPGSPTSSEPVYEPTSEEWQGREPGLGPGVMVGRPSRDRHPSGSAGSGFGAPPTYECQTLTTLTFIRPDGTEITFRDQKSDGRPYRGINGFTYSRGTVFVTKDGSAATFVSDQPITDIACNSTDAAIMLGYKRVYPTGYLTWKNGVRYRIEDGYVRWMRDRNGNKVLPAVDALGRQITFTVNGLTYNGVGGSSHSIRILTGSLESALRYDVPSIKTYGQLFPELVWSGSNNTYNPQNLTSAIIMPDNKQYTLRYNEYGELARVELPTGGAIEYDYDGGACYTRPCSGVIGIEGRPIYRRVVARRVYSKGGRGADYDIKTTYDVSGVVVTVTTYNKAGSVLSLSEHSFKGSAYDSLTSTTFKWYEPFDTGREIQTDILSTDGHRTLLRRTVYTYDNYPHQLPPYDGNLVDVDRPQDPYLKEVKATLADARLVSKQTFVNDRYGNQTDVWEYDFGTGEPGKLLRRAHTDYEYSAAYTDAQSGAHLRNLPTQQWTSSDGTESNKVSLTVYAYDQSTPADCPNIISHDAAFTTTYATRGNLTSVTRYANAADRTGAITLTTQYDIAGNVVSVTDPKGHKSEFSYEDSYSDLNNARNTYAYPTSTASAVPDPSNQRGANTPLTTSTVYDFSTGKVFSQTDANGQVTTFTYADEEGRPDPLDRLRGVGLPGGGGVAYDYGDAVGNLFIRTRMAIDTSRHMESYQYFDGLGRATRSFARDGAGEGREWVVKDTEYDSMGRVRRVSNPYFVRTLGGNLEDANQVEWTTTAYDALGRIESITTPDGAQVGTDYEGAQVTVIDQTGRRRSSVTDALGRLVKVMEDPDSLSHQTIYTYDALDNLTEVSQGVQTRIYVYDSLSRLILARNPEQEARLTDTRTDGSWSVSYEYDENGNLKKRRDARGVESGYSYDALNRVTGRSYNDNSTPWVTYTYDTGYWDAQGEFHEMPNARGRLTQVKNGVSAHNYTAYDEMGRVRQSEQVTDNQTYSMGYTYDLAGNLKTRRYPSGRVVTTSYDTAGRVASVEGELGSDSRTYAWSFAYAAHGAVEGVKLGNGLWEQTSFNSRHQPVQVGLGTSAIDTSKLRLDYTFGEIVDGNLVEARNNGNVQSQRIRAPGLDLTQSYVYDGLNRLRSAQETSGSNQVWKQVFRYDQYGNRNFDLGTTTLPGDLDDLINNPEIDAATNRIKENQNGHPNKEYAYDAAGNLTGNASGQMFTYDADNMQTSFNGGWQAGGANYSYDGNGRRVRKVTAAGTTLFVYDAVGMLVAEYTTEAEPSDAGGTKYLTADALGTPRVITDKEGDVVSRHDYLPFGEELRVGVGGRANGSQPGQEYVFGVKDVNIRQKFTSKERDAESGLDYFGARYYASAHGRFSSIDPMHIAARHLVNPQDLNRYQYVGNNPLAFIDPDGKEKIRLIIRTFIPQPQYGPLKGDGRRVGQKGTSRTTQEITIETNRRKTKDETNALVDHQKATGISVGPGLVANPSPIGPPVTVGMVIRQAKGDTIQATAEHDRNISGTVHVNAKSSEAYPSLPTPSIDYNFKFEVSEWSNGQIRVTLDGKHDGFPAYEVFAVRENDDEEQLIYSHDPRDTNQTGLSLYGDGEFTVTNETVFLHPPNKKK